VFLEVYILPNNMIIERFQCFNDLGRKSEEIDVDYVRGDPNYWPASIHRNETHIDYIDPIKIDCSYITRKIAEQASAAQNYIAEVLVDQIYRI
jgi:hypothetical protein